MKTRQNLIIVSLIGIFVVAGLIFMLFQSPQKDGGMFAGEARGVAGDPIDVTLDFYELWTLARESTTTDPYAEKLTENMSLSLELSKKLLEAEAAFKEKVEDPVLCQSSVPEKLKAKPVFSNGDAAQFLIFPKNNEFGVQSVVTLASHDGLWEITDIKCSYGDVAPEQGEFTFENEGFLLQKSAQPPLNPADWHLVFEQDGVLGYFVPLFFSEASTCTSQNGVEETCQESMLGETMKVAIKGNMSEAGVEVKKLEFLK